MPYRLSALAEQDLEEIWSYVAGDASPATADRLIDAIIERFELTFHRPAQTGCWLVRHNPRYHVLDTRSTRTDSSQF
jgi:plasmid stabilization system protein ParE